MGETTKRLRPYQVRLVTDVCRTSDDVLVEQPTGSGKTVQIVTLVAMQLGRRFSHAVISAPQEQIEQGFVQRDYQTIAFPVCPGVAVAPILAPAALIKGARESKLGSVKRVIHYLRQPGPLDHAFACTHAALNRLTPDDLPADLSGKALFIDEAHHASADGLTQIVTLWRERRGQLFFFTATPYRGDGRPVRLDGMRSYRRSLAEHMAEGFAPGRLESEIVALGQPGDAITAGQFTGEEAPPSSYFDGLVAAICRRWLEDGKPKAIVRVPPMKGGRSGDLVSRLMHALASQGARVLDATGTGAADKQRFLTGLEAEKSRTYATSEFDVMVGIQRVLEGTDWPVCSAVYCVGMPGSLNTVVQFLGRAMRLKGEDCPAELRDKARLVFFVPCGGGTALADLSLDHSRHALLTCCFLADHEVGQEWIVLREVRRGIEAALGSPRENPAAADAENEADEALDPEVRAEVELVMADAREQIISQGGEPTVGEVVEWAAKTRPDLPEPAIQRVAAEILAAQPTSSGETVREAIQREMATRLRIDPMVKQAMAEVFGAVLDEFRGMTLQDSAVLASVGRQVHGVTGGQMREFTERLRQAAPRPLTEEQILAWADAHYERTGKWPHMESGLVEEGQSENWKNVSAALQNGHRGLSGGTTLAQLLVEKRGMRSQVYILELTVEQIVEWMDAYRERTGRWPTRDSGIIDGTDGEKWANIDAVLKRGGRGLEGGNSLRRLLSEKRGVRIITDLSDLTPETILAWADAHHGRTGQWPKNKSGVILEDNGGTWNAVDVALIQGLRNLPGGSSLAKLLAENRGGRHLKNLPLLTQQQIIVWVEMHRTRTGEWPKRDSGDIAGAPGETWRIVDRALRCGQRGLRGGSSLFKFIQEKVAFNR
jgi:superfamily II DNA or RNA helicase